MQFAIPLQFDAAMWRDEGWSSSFLRRLSGVGPVEGVGHRRVVIGDEVADFILQIFYRSEVSTPENFSLNDAEDDLDLVEPRTVFWQVHEVDAVSGVREELASRGL